MKSTQVPWTIILGWLANRWPIVSSVVNRIAPEREQHSFLVLCPWSVEWCWVHPQHTDERTAGAQRFDCWTRICMNALFYLRVMQHTEHTDYDYVNIRAGNDGLPVSGFKSFEGWSHKNSGLNTPPIVSLGLNHIFWPIKRWTHAGTTHHKCLNFWWLSLGAVRWYTVIPARLHKSTPETSSHIPGKPPRCQRYTTVYSYRGFSSWTPEVFPPQLTRNDRPCPSTASINHHEASIN